MPSVKVLFKNLQRFIQKFATFYSKYSHQNISASIPAIFRVMFLLQEYSCG